MVFNNIFIQNLRNHQQTEINFNRKLNIINGLNGSGKTTILEGLAICSFSKSFLQVLDSALINSNEDFYSVTAELFNDLRLNYKIKIYYKYGQKKQISSTYSEHLNPQDIIGVIPLVVLSPDLKIISTGSPADRRLFLDRILAQSNKKYLKNIINQKKIVRQRNNLLNQYKLGRISNESIIEPWTNLLIKNSSDIFIARLNFIKEFQPLFQNFYYIISSKKEFVNLEYLPNKINKLDFNSSFNDDKIHYAFYKSFLDVRVEELRRGTTLFGTQKDDIKITINSGLAREYASQGQHKTLLISIKLAEFEYLKEITQETPVVLFDDIFSELDIERSEKVLDIILSGSAQCFITITDSNYLKRFINNSEATFFEVHRGKVNPN